MTSKKPDRTFIVLVTLVLAAFAICLLEGGWNLALSGLIEAGVLFESVWLRLILGFVMAGMIQILIPRELVSKWIGPTSGLKGILIASYASILLPGSPYVWLPVYVSIYRTGAGIGPIMALLTARGLLSLQLLLIWQVPFLDLELPLVRYLLCLIVPPFVALASQAIFRVTGEPSDLIKGRTIPKSEDR
jgi:uncharacterized membrane protein YraQ (UPF0718 family)